MNLNSILVITYPLDFWTSKIFLKEILIQTEMVIIVMEACSVTENQYPNNVREK